jgi:myo-inositol-1(or 4)-monophosphatase
MRGETEAAIAAVEEGLDLAQSRRGADELTLKAERDFVTGTDVAVEEAIRAALGNAFDFAVAGEEGGRDRPADGSPYWLVDPICGTRNFAFGIPLYCVNVALVEDEEVVAAVVGDASTGEIQVAERGRGAWALADGARRLLATSVKSEAIVIEDSHNDPDPARRERAAAAIGNAIRAFRWDLQALSTSLALPYVAAGRVAAYVLFSSSALHVGAGSLLVSEAGGTVSDIDGQRWTIHSDSILASATPALHDELLAISAPPEDY